MNVQGKKVASTDTAKFIGDLLAAARGGGKSYYLIFETAQGSEEPQSIPRTPSIPPSKSLADERKGTPILPSRPGSGSKIASSTRRASAVACATSANVLRDTQPEECVRIVCISDTHCEHKSLTPTTSGYNPLALPDGDILIHAGDCLCESGLRHATRTPNGIEVLKQAD